jgi:hypothetical protein
MEVKEQYQIKSRNTCILRFLEKVDYVDIIRLGILF